MRKKGVVLAVYSDTHPNSQVGLCVPGGVERDLGGRYEPSVCQQWIWECWLDYWATVKRVAKEERAKEIYAVQVGDGVDDNSHSKCGLITMNLAEMIELSKGVLQPVRDVADRLFVVRGTSTHVHRQGDLEELVARVVEAETHSTGWRSAYRWFVDAGGVYCDFAHRPRSNSTRPWTRGGGALRTARMLQDEYARLSRAGKVKWFPKLAFRGHFHHPEDSGIGNAVVRVFFNPCWSLHGDFEQERQFNVEALGGWIVFCREGEYRVVGNDARLYWPEREDPWQSNV